MLTDEYVGRGLRLWWCFPSYLKSFRINAGKGAPTTNFINFKIEKEKAVLLKAIRCLLVGAALRPHSRRYT
jgi:hypothetical protein